MGLGKRMAWALLALAFLAVAGCKVSLYADLDQEEANEILACLVGNGISADKTPGTENKWSLAVEKADVARAVDILKNAGLPREKFATMGELFQKQGLVSSPLEERARYIYSLGQQISEALSKIDGVLVARTLIVLPDNDPLGERLLPSSASVFIKYQQDTDVESSIPQIKKLVINSVEGLTYEKVSVILFPAAESPADNRAETDRVWGVRVAPGSAGLLRVLLYGMAALVLLALAGVGFALHRAGVGFDLIRARGGRMKVEDSE